MRKIGRKETWYDRYIEKQKRKAKKSSYKQKLIIQNDRKNLMFDRINHLRANPTKSEEMLRDALKGLNLGEFVFQHGIMISKYNFYIADFYHKTSNTVIEVDGNSHDNRKDYDKKRDDSLDSIDIQTIRVTVCQVYNDLPNILDSIIKIIKSRGSRKKR